MKILRIEKMLQKEDTLNEVLKELEDDFNKIDSHAKVMKAGITNNPEEAKNALNVLTGTYSNLSTVYSLVESEKKNRELKAYHKIKVDSDKKGTKFISAASERQASLEVANYRRLRNIIEGYKNACEKDISTLQSLLKYMGIEYNQPTE